jgi:hypothetical protein
MDRRNSRAVAGVDALRCFSEPWHVVDRVLAHLWLGDRFHPSAACDEGIFAECVRAWDLFTMGWITFVFQCRMLSPWGSSDDCCFGGFVL